MSEWDWVFFYNEEHNNVESVTTYHQQQCDIGSLAEAHPEKIYFYARFAPLLEWDFNEVAHHPTLFDVGPDYSELYAGTHADPIMTLPEEHKPRKIFENVRIHSLSLDSEPNAFGGTIELICNGTKGCRAEKHANDCPKWEE